MRRWWKHWAGILVSDGYGVYCQRVHARQTCLAQLMRRARGLAERRIRAGRVWAPGAGGVAGWSTGPQAPPTAGAVQTWDARLVQLLGQHRDRQDAAGTFAHTLERELGTLWTFVVEAGVDATNNRASRPCCSPCSGASSGRGPTTRRAIAGWSASSRCGRRVTGGSPPVSSPGRSGHLLCQWPASGCLLDLTY